MKKRIIYLVLAIFLLSLLGSCSSTKMSTSYNQLVGSWVLDSKYIDTVPQNTALTILNFKSDNTVEIYEYVPTAEQPATVFRTDSSIPDISAFTLKETSPVTVNGNTVSYQYQGNTIEATFSVELNSMTMHLYIKNAENKSIHEIYKTADKGKRP